MNDNGLDLAPIEARRAGASRGKWEASEYFEWDEGVRYDLADVLVLSDEEPVEVVVAVSLSIPPRDAEFIAHSPEDIDALLAEVKRLREEREEIWHSAFESVLAAAPLENKLWHAPLNPYSAASPDASNV